MNGFQVFIRKISEEGKDEDDEIGFGESIEEAIDNALPID